MTMNYVIKKSSHIEKITSEDKVRIAPSANKSSDISFCDENVLYDLLNKYNYLTCLLSARCYSICLGIAVRL